MRFLRFTPSFSQPTIVVEAFTNNSKGTNSFKDISSRELNCTLFTNNEELELIRVDAHLGKATFFPQATVTACILPKLGSRIVQLLA